MKTAAIQTAAIQRDTSSRAFTLIEVMVVVAIIGLVAGLGFVAVAKGFHRNPIQQATEDLKDICRQARNYAIAQCTVTEVHINPQEGNLDWGLAPVDVTLDGGITNAPPSGQSLQTSDEAEAVAKAKQPKVVPHQWPLDRLNIELLDVNFHPMKDANVAKIRFYANGTCDECTVVLFFPENGEHRKIDLELVTGQVDIHTF